MKNRSDIELSLKSHFTGPMGFGRCSLASLPDRQVPKLTADCILGGITAHLYRQRAFCLREQLELVNLLDAATAPEGIVLVGQLERELCVGGRPAELHQFEFGPFSRKFVPNREEPRGPRGPCFG